MSHVLISFHVIHTYNTAVLLILYNCCVEFFIVSESNLLLSDVKTKLCQTLSSFIICRFDKGFVATKLTLVHGKNATLTDDTR